MVIVAAVALSVSLAAGAWGQTPAKTEKVEVVATVGCLREASPNTWTLDQATDPVPSHANAVAPKEVEKKPRRGAHQPAGAPRPYRAHQGHRDQGHAHEPPQCHVGDHGRAVL
jgi:hypothetical protein